MPKIKGTHNAMKSGMLLAEEIAKEINNNGDLSGYSKAIKDSSIFSELKKVRNIRPSFRNGLLSNFHSILSTILKKNMDTSNMLITPVLMKQKIKKINYPNLMV